MILDSLSQIESTPKMICAKRGEKWLALRYFDFLQIFWSRTLKNYYINDLYQFLESFEPKQNFFSQKFKISQFPEFFQFFLENDCNLAIIDSMTSLKASNGFVYFTFWPQDIKNSKKKSPRNLTISPVMAT